MTWQECWTWPVELHRLCVGSTGFIDLKVFLQRGKEKKNRSATITVTNVSFFRGLRRTLCCKVSARQAQPRKVSATVCICTRVFLEFEYRYGHVSPPREFISWIISLKCAHAHSAAFKRVHAVRFIRVESRKNPPEEIETRNYDQPCQFTNNYNYNNDVQDNSTRTIVETTKWSVYTNYFHSGATSF